MKRNYLFKNISRICLSAGILAATLLSSCKDNSPGSVDFSKSPALVGFQYTGFNAVPMNTKLFQQSNQVRYIEITLSVASLTLKTPVTVTVVDDPAGFANYQATVDPNAVLLSPSLYSLANGGKITIQPGQQIVKLAVTFAGNAIDFTQDNVVAFKIASAPGATVASNLDEIVLPLVLQSVYEGEYVNTGSFNDVTSAPASSPSASLNIQIYPENIDLLTVTAQTVDFYDLSYNAGYFHPIEGGSSYYGSFDAQFTFGTTGQVTSVTNYYGQNSGPHVRSAVLDPTGINAASGTPGTAGFKIQVSYILEQSGTPRTYFDETYTYVGPAQ